LIELHSETKFVQIFLQKLPNFRKSDFGNRFFYKKTDFEIRK
jgi:hypothetical protein